MNKTELDLIKQEKRAYMKEWRKNNKNRIKVINSRYWLKRAAKIKQEIGDKDDNNN